MDDVDRKLNLVFHNLSPEAQQALPEVMKAIQTTGVQAELLAEVLAAMVFLTPIPYLEFFQAKLKLLATKQLQDVLLSEKEN